MNNTISLKTAPGTVGDPVLSGTVVTHSPAEYRFAELQNAVQNFHVLLTEAIRADDWRALGYPDLAAWYQDVTAGRSVSPQARGELALALQERDYSLRAIGGILHVTKSTVQRNIALAQGDMPEEPRAKEEPAPPLLRPRGRITLPVEVREALGAQAGDRLEFKVVGPGVIQVRLIPGTSEEVLPVRKGYQLVPVADGRAAKGGLSHANGNCVLVTRLAGGYVVTDSKLGAASPAWTLSGDQFRRLGELVTRWLSWADVAPRSASLGDGAVFGVRRSGDGYAFSLTGHADLFFSAGEYRAFCWGYQNGQFRPGAPVRRLRFRETAPLTVRGHVRCAKCGKCLVINCKDGHEQCACPPRVGAGN